MKIIIFFILSLSLSHRLMADSAERDSTSTVQQPFTESITVLADPWCPYNCRPGDKPGFGVELARSIFAEHGIELIYILKGWQQSLDDVRAGKHNAVVSAYKSDAPDFIYPGIHYSYAQTCFFSRKGNSWRYEGVESFAQGQQVFGVMNGYSYGINIDDYIELHKNDATVKIVGGLDVLDQLLHLLDTGKIDVMVEDKNVFRHKLLGRSNANQYQIVGCQPRAKLFLGFSPATPASSKRYAKILEGGLIEALRSGRARRISDKYGISHD